MQIPVELRQRSWYHQWCPAWERCCGSDLCTLGPQLKKCANAGADEGGAFVEAPASSEIWSRFGHQKRGMVWSSYPHVADPDWHIKRIKNIFFWRLEGVPRGAKMGKVTTSRVCLLEWHLSFLSKARLSPKVPGIWSPASSSPHLEGQGSSPT